MYQDLDVQTILISESDLLSTLILNIYNKKSEDRFLFLNSKQSN